MIRGRRVDVHRGACRIPYEDLRVKNALVEDIVMLLARLRQSFTLALISGWRG